ncbi:MAG: excinuclease ABC subunit UvrA [Clostridia bacterium]|nr:excinuclease ABC subunit UvrA [Clostridia bacterium]
MIKDTISVRGAREHNLKNINVDIPRDKLVVITGLSGSGKSSLAFDTIYAEGQRKYVESLSSYARQFLGRMDKPDVDNIQGLSPAISIDQKTTSRNPRSTVGTVTEIYDYLRLLYARVGKVHCHQCGKPITQQTIDQMIDAVSELPEGTKYMILAPVVRGRKGEYTKLIESLKKDGYVRARIDGEIVDLQDDIDLERYKKHTIEVVIDRLVAKDDNKARLTDSMELALKLASGLAIVKVIDGEEMQFSSNYACTDCGITLEEITPRMFSFNNPYGACPECTGLGTVYMMDPDAAIKDWDLSIEEGAINVGGWTYKEGSYASSVLKELSSSYGFSLSTPLKDLTAKQKDVLLYGTKGKALTIKYSSQHGEGTYKYPYEGLMNSLERRYKQTNSQGMKEYYESFMRQTPCRVCGGKRLRKESLSVLIDGKDISTLTEYTIADLTEYMEKLKFADNEEIISEPIMKELNERLKFLIDVGLTYLSLSRGAATLSGGEAQRIRLATQIGSSLMGVLYVLDEPSIGLHQRDNLKLLGTLKRLRDLGNTLIVVEHDEDTMRHADHIIDMGPGPGVHGGEIVAEGDVNAIMDCEASLTGQFLKGVRKIEVPSRRKAEKGNFIRIEGAGENNLKGINVDIPIGLFTCVTGVSGSGKSSLVNEILYKSLAKKLNRANTKAGKHKDIKGVEKLDKVIDIDQSPIGRTPRSNPATYTGMFTLIRDLFSKTVDAKSKGYKAGRFSFNVKGGRCEACQGDGIIKIEMHFLPDVYVPCEVCGGKRYNNETLNVKYKGKNISDVLDMTVEDALEFFKNVPNIAAKVQTLYDVGLGYIKLGQPSTQLSGGEAQRIKLATELSKRSTGRTLYILDEPTTGLHIADTEHLLLILQRLVDNKNTVVVIEHNLEVIKSADYIIDLGPEGGDKGGTVICTGTPEQVSDCDVSYTGQFLKQVLK